MQASVSEYRRWTLLSSIVKWLRLWAPNTDALELERCGNDIRRIAADAGLSVADLRRLVPLSRSATLLPHMIEALNLDSDAIPTAVLRDLQRVCSLCKNKTECVCELARGGADTTYVDFCPNAETLRSLQLVMDQWPVESSRRSGGDADQAS